MNEAASPGPSAAAGSESTPVGPGDPCAIITTVNDASTRRSADGTRLDEPTGEILVPLVAADTGPAQEWAEAADHDQVASPTVLDAGPTHLNVTRTFCFADLSGFTAFTREHGPHEAVERLGEFRRITRNVAAKRGVRVAKWLGDGVMLVGTAPSPTIAAGAHLIHHFSRRSTDLRVGIATGVALLFEGDDYIGEPVNLAAKLCAAAQRGEMLAVCDTADLPDWVRADGDVSVRIKGVGSVGGIHRLSLAV